MGYILPCNKDLTHIFGRLLRRAKRGFSAKNRHFWQDAKAAQSKCLLPETSL